MATNLSQFYPFATGPGSNVTEAQWRVMAEGWLPTGIVAGEDDELAVVPSVPAAMTVGVSTGQARLRGHVGLQTAAATLVIGANASGSTRIDLVVVRADFVNDVIQFDVVAGTPGSGVAPAVTQDASVWELALAEVTVASGAASIIAADLADVRTYVTPGGGIDLGLVIAMAIAL